MVFHYVDKSPGTYHIRVLIKYPITQYKIVYAPNPTRGFNFWRTTGAAACRIFMRFLFTCTFVKIYFYRRNCKKFKVPYNASYWISETSARNIRFYQLLAYVHGDNSTTHHQQYHQSNLDVRYFSLGLSRGRFSRIYFNGKQNGNMYKNRGARRVPIPRRTAYEN